jgi:hypothetical protein
MLLKAHYKSTSPMRDGTDGGKTVKTKKISKDRQETIK